MLHVAPHYFMMTGFHYTSLVLGIHTWI